MSPEDEAALFARVEKRVKEAKRYGMGFIVMALEETESLLALAQAKGGGKDLGDEPYDSQPASVEDETIAGRLEAAEHLIGLVRSPPSPPSPSPWPSEEQIEAARKARAAYIYSHAVPTLPYHQMAAIDREATRLSLLAAGPPPQREAGE